jgi:broad specificity phosphatase PhoE
MPATHVHLVRHGEVHNPGGVLYGRLPHFHLSENGKEMALAAAKALVSAGVKPSKLVVSPLIRTQESAAPIAELFGQDIDLDERIIEPYNMFEGRKVSAKTVMLRPHLVFHLRNPLQPSWGESYVSVVERMMKAMKDVADSVAGGEVVMVTHQLPIWMVHRHLAGDRLAHNPSKRRCALSSITSFEYVDGKFREVGYQDPAAELKRIDKGAV